MKSLGQLLFIIIITTQLSNVFANDVAQRDFTNLTFTEIVKSSLKETMYCQNKSKIKKNQVLDLISDYINEVNYRCSNSRINNNMKTTCNLTLYRLKSDRLKCDTIDYYENKVSSYLN